MERGKVDQLGVSKGQVSWTRVYTGEKMRARKRLNLTKE